MLNALQSSLQVRSLTCSLLDVQHRQLCLNDRSHPWPHPREVHRHIWGLPRLLQPGPVIYTENLTHR